MEENYKEQLFKFLALLSYGYCIFIICFSVYFSIMALDYYPSIGDYFGALLVGVIASVFYWIAFLITPPAEFGLVTIILIINSIAFYPLLLFGNFYIPMWD